MRLSLKGTIIIRLVSDERLLSISAVQLIQHPDRRGSDHLGTECLNSSSGFHLVNMDGYARRHVYRDDDSVRDY